jgi:hypothetical protein
MKSGSFWSYREAGAFGEEAFSRYDYDYLEPPEPLDEDEAERQEDAYWDEVDRAYDEMKDRRGEVDF